MAGMIVQHNLNAINANNKLNINVLGTKKATEKLSSGFRINRAADDAAGLAISEKMRAQIRGIGQAIRNANDGISLIQTAEGALDETHDMLKRLKELAVQAGNETYSDEERTYMQQEIDAIKTEVDRIAKATDFNGIKLLDGSLGGAAGSSDDFGARYGVKVTSGNTANIELNGSSVTSSVEDVTVSFNTGASGVGAEFATWDDTGKNLVISLSNGVAYTQAQIDTLVKNANYEKGTVQSAIPNVKVTLSSGVLVGKDGLTFGSTAAGVRAESVTGDNNLTGFLVSASNGTEFFADKIQLVSNSYGVDTRTITIRTNSDTAAGRENVKQTVADLPGEKTGTFELNLATGVSYSAQDIQNILAKSGYGLDYEVKLSSSIAPNGDVKFQANAQASLNLTMGVGTNAKAGAGLGKDSLKGAGSGLTLQIGANNAVEQRMTVAIGAMDSSAIGIANISVRTTRDAQDAMDRVGAAITAVSAQRATLGAMQNRLEHTVNSLTVSSENLTAAEAQIRDTDMATEMVNYTKFAILQQAAQAMLAQANQAPQAILQLLQ